jgi:hypothetical protein
MKEEEENNKGSEEGAPYIELVWSSTQDLIDLQSNEEFSDFVLLKSYDTIKKSIEDKLDTAELFNIFNMSIIIELDRKNFHIALQNITEYFLKIEDYEECRKIKTLIDKI